MHAKSITLTLICLAAGAGCQSSRPGTVITLPTSAVRKAAVAPAARPAAAKSQVGRPVQDVIAAAKGLRMQFFTLDDKALDGLPAQAAGSVSIHAADGAGQDNYRFDETGRIDRHLRSYGANYAAGVWEPVP